MGAIFRVENPETDQGLWYNKEGNFAPFIKTLSGAKCADLPMGFDPRYKADGHAWLSGCDDLPQMRQWFSQQDLIELGQAGYHLYRFTVTDYKQVPGHAVFTRESVIETARLDLNLLF